MSFFPVSLYIAVFTASIASPLSAAVALSLFNSAGVVGQILIGYFTDRFPYPRIMFISAVGCCLSAFFMWGFADTLATTFAFTVVFGGLVRSASYAYCFESLIACRNVGRRIPIGPVCSSCRLRRRQSRTSIDCFNGSDVYQGRCSSARTYRVESSA